VVSGGCTQNWVQLSISTAVGMRWGRRRCVVSGGCTQSWVQLSSSITVGMRWGGVKEGGGVGCQEDAHIAGFS
jgi:hypothetical protein